MQPNLVSVCLSTVVATDVQCAIRRSDLLYRCWKKQYNAGSVQTPQFWMANTFVDLILLGCVQYSKYFDKWERNPVNRQVMKALTLRCNMHFNAYAQILDTTTEQWAYSNYFYCFKSGCYEPILVTENQSLTVTTNTWMWQWIWYAYINYCSYA